MATQSTTRCLWAGLLVLCFGGDARGEVAEEAYCAAVRCATVFEHYATHYDLYQEILQHRYGWDPAQVYAIVAPEVANYTRWQDRLETALLNAIYVNFGIEYLDMSIGMYQMKMSFVESLETILQRRLANRDAVFRRRFGFLLDYDGSNRAQRAARVARMQDIRWQTYYLSLFYHIMEEKYRENSFEGPVEKLVFYSTAYNVGFQNSVETIEQKIADALSPNAPTQAFGTYADRALYFYHRLHFGNWTH